MTAQTRDFVLATPEGMLAVGPVVAGVVVVALLIRLIRVGIRVRGREPGPPRPHEQPHPPEGGPVGPVQERREPDEVPRQDEGRLRPHEFHDGLASRPSADQRRRRWSPGSGGSFGSGGSGAT
jgi:hypothetical protein